MQEIDDDALELIVTQGHSLAFGARFLKRVIDERIKLPISAHWQDSSRFHVRAKGSDVVVDVVREYQTSESRVVRVPRDQWILLPEIHAGYITWEEYEENLRRLQVNAQASGPDRRRSPPREGPALLQGLALCGHCGERMTVRYHCYPGKPVPDYWCGRRRINHGEPGVCQTIHGGALDDAIGDILVETMTPLALEVALTVQQELAARAAEADRIRQQQVERARYEADVA